MSGGLQHQAQETSGCTDDMPLAAVNFGQGRTRTGTSERQGCRYARGSLVMLARHSGRGSARVLRVGPLRRAQQQRRQLRGAGAGTAQQNAARGW